MIINCLENVICVWNDPNGSQCRRNINAFNCEINGNESSERHIVTQVVGL